MTHLEAIEVVAPDDAPASVDELREYRRIRPLLLAMIEDWQKLKSPQGCPAMRHILAPD